jgi:hypothetical protein
MKETEDGENCVKSSFTSSEHLTGSIKSIPFRTSGDKKTVKK